MRGTIDPFILEYVKLVVSDLSRAVKELQQKTVASIPLSGVDVYRKSELLPK